MVQITNEQSAEIERLIIENSLLRQQLAAAKASVEAIKNGGIDAIVFAGEQDLKIYSASTADKTYRILVERMNEGAVTLTKDGTILYCNSCFASMVNLPLEKIVGINFKKFITKTFQKRIEALLNESGETSLKEEINLHASRRKKLAVLLTATTFLVDTIFVLSIILTDLSFQKKDQEELKRRTREVRQKNKELYLESKEKEKRSAQLTSANKELESFNYVASHDLQEPLRKIQTFATRILETDYETLSDTGKGYFRRIEKAARRMQTLIEDLLSFSQTNVSEQKFEKLDLNKIIDDIAEELNEAFPQNPAVILSKGMCDVIIIPFQFRQLLQNLISNALKFSLPGVPTQIMISSETKEGRSFGTEGLLPGKMYCHIRFSDNGIGFDPQYKDKIFDVFQRLNSKDEYSGTGIGLSIVKKIIENHSGVITATSGPGQGATFDIYLPAG
jgi:signal transduction histidine kinase